MHTLEKAAGATAVWLHGPFYPSSMEWLAGEVTKVQPVDSIDLDPRRWVERAGYEWFGLYGFDEFDDGSRAWYAIGMRVGTAVVWLTIPHMVQAPEGGGRVFERLPALYLSKVSPRKLTSGELELVAARLASTFSRE